MADRRPVPRIAIALAAAIREAEARRAADDAQRRATMRVVEGEARRSAA